MRLGQCEGYAIQARYLNLLWGIIAACYVVLHGGILTDDSIHQIAIRNSIVQCSYIGCSIAVHINNIAVHVANDKITVHDIAPIVHKLLLRWHQRHRRRSHGSILIIHGVALITVEIGSYSRMLTGVHHAHDGMVA